MHTIPQRVFPVFSREWEELLFQTKFLAVGTSLGHLSTKKFSDWSCRLGPKIRKREGAEEVVTTHLPITKEKLTSFPNHEDDKIHLQKNFDDNTFKDKTQ